MERILSIEYDDKEIIFEGLDKDNEMEVCLLDDHEFNSLYLTIENIKALKEHLEYLLKDK